MLSGDVEVEHPDGPGRLANRYGRIVALCSASPSLPDRCNRNHLCIDEARRHQCADTGWTALPSVPWVMRFD